jgi:drug/metabolite transporter (DMT)-like permease
VRSAGADEVRPDRPWSLFGERLAPLALVGMAVCVVGVFLVNWRVMAKAPHDR